MPYRAFSNFEVVDRVSKGHRLEQPARCPSHVYSLMKKCWDEEPERRPSFEHLFKFLEEMLEN